MTPGETDLRLLALGAVVDAAEEAAGYPADPALRERTHGLMLAAQRLVKPLVAALADTALRTAGTDTEDGAA